MFSANQDALNKHSIILHRIGPSVSRQVVAETTSQSPIYPFIAEQAKLSSQFQIMTLPITSPSIVINQYFMLK